MWVVFITTWTLDGIWCLRENPKWNVMMCHSCQLSLKGQSIPTAPLECSLTASVPGDESVRKTARLKITETHPPANSTERIGYSPRPLQRTLTLPMSVGVVRRPSLTSLRCSLPDTRTIWSDALHHTLLSNDQE